MKFLSSFVPLIIVAATTVSSIPLTRRTVNEARVPQSRISARVNPIGNGECFSKGANGQPFLIPCPSLADRAAINDASTYADLSARQSAPSPPLTLAQVNALAPQLGFTAGKNPSGTGNCDGAVNGANGQPIQVPCTCPPDQATFDQSLLANANAGHAVNNPSVPISFPEDNSVASQLARVNAAIVTLQNLSGPGQGCPAASTTFSAQQAALQQQQL